MGVDRSPRRTLAAELSPQGIRVICLRSGAIPETPQIEEVFGIHAESYGPGPKEFQARSEAQTLRGELPTLAELATVAAFVASDQAKAMTATAVNLSGGAIVRLRARVARANCREGSGAGQRATLGSLGAGLAASVVASLSP